MANIIFYLEDDKFLCDSFASHFRRKDYEVHTFQSATDAEEALKTIKPHIIISDQKLGNESLGWEFLKKSILLSPLSIRFILSGYSDSAMILNSFKEGVVFDYISKSAPTEEIALKIKNACLLIENIHAKDQALETRTHLVSELLQTTKELASVKNQLVSKEQEIIELRKKLSKF